MGLKITVLGSSAAIPTKKRWLSCQVIACEQSLFLIDCGEGAQFRMQQFKIKKNSINHIFISHLHGDHFFGLVGFLNSLHLNQRKEPMHIYAPEPLQKYLKHTFSLSNTTLFFPLLFHPLLEIENHLLFEDQFLTIHSFPLIHSIPTWGFIFREKPKQRNIKRDFIEQYHPNYEIIKEIKQGKNFITDDGTIIENRFITHNPPSPGSYAYLSDTKLNLDFKYVLSNIDVLYHEATFSTEEEELAMLRGHTTAKQAAILAKEAQVKQLLLGHISARFVNDESILEKEAVAVFPNSKLVEDGMSYDIGN